MVFEVCLVNDVQSVMVVHGIHPGIVGVVACAHGIDVVLLHESDIAQHRFVAHCSAVERVAVVAVDTFQNHALTVDIQLVV